MAESDVSRTDNQSRRFYDLLLVSQCEDLRRHVEHALSDQSTWMCDLRLRMLDSVSSFERRLSQDPPLALVLWDERVASLLDLEVFGDMTAQVILIGRLESLAQSIDLHMVLPPDVSAPLLRNAIASALRVFENRHFDERRRWSIICDGAANLWRQTSPEQLATVLFEHCISLDIGIGDALIAGRYSDQWRLITGYGVHSDQQNRLLSEVVDDEILKNMLQLERGRQTVATENLRLDLIGSSDRPYLIVLRFVRPLGQLQTFWLRHLCFVAGQAIEQRIAIEGMEQVQHEALWTLGELAESRASEMGRHTKRVAAYAFELAVRAGLSETEAKLLKNAATMHDVGMLSVPRRVLNKSGELSDEERDLVRKHPAVGREMLEKARHPLMRAAAIVAGQHHERWDGDGYPLGLRGEDIHIYGRIVALADVFDVLSVRRVHKPAWPIDRVLAFIKGESGGHFDPALVRILLSDLHAFLSIREAHTQDWERDEAALKTDPNDR